MDFLNEQVAPHQIGGLSLYEEAHPCESKEINSTVLIKGNLKEGGLQAQDYDIKGPIYRYQIFKRDSGNWDEMHDEICQFVDEKGTDAIEFRVATANITDGDSQMAVVIWWEKAHREALFFEERGGCCTIF